MSENYALEFFKTTFQIHRHLHRAVVERLPVRMTAVEAMIIHFLEKRNSSKTSDLMEHLGIPASTLTGILDRLEKRGMITRNRDSSDRRVVMVTLNPKNVRMEEQFEKIITDYLQHNSLNFPTQWWKTMTEELKKLEQMMRKMEEGQRGTD